MRDRVAAALAAIRPETYASWRDGAPVRQVSNPRLVARMLRLLDPPAAATVLEIGTGSGYSAALLSRLVGPRGRVVSLDVDPELVARARRVQRDAGARNVRFIRRDGRLGYAEEAPFDALVSWASADLETPPAWRYQIRAGGTIVAPFADGRVRKLRALRDGELVEEASIAGRFVPLTSEPFRPWEGTL